MPNIRYAGDEPSTEAFGKTFVAGEWTDDADLDAEAVAILAQNPQFMVTEGKSDAKSKAAASPPEPEPVVEAAPEPTPVEAEPAS